MRGLCSFGLVLGALVCTSSGAVGASLELMPEPACAEARDLDFRVERSIGKPLRTAAPLHFDLSITRDGDGFVALLGIAEQNAAPSRQRRIEAPDCETLVETVVVAMGLALGEAGDEAALAATAPANTTPSAVVASPAEGSTARDTPPPVAERSLAEPAAALSAWLVADVGSLPAPSLGAALAAELAWQRVRLVVLGTVLFDRAIDVASPDVPGAGATLGLASGGALACTPLLMPEARLSLRVCLGGEVGRLAGIGTGISEPRRGGILWLAPRLDVLASVAVPESPLRLGLWLTAAVPSNRDEFVIDGVGLVHRPPAITGRGAFGAELRFE